MSLRFIDPITVSGSAHLICREICYCLIEGTPQCRARRQCGIEALCEPDGNRVLDPARRRNHNGHTGIKKSLSLRLRRTSVQKDKLKAILLRKERGKAFRAGSSGLSSRRFELQQIAVGVPAEVEYRDSAPVPRLLEDIENVVSRTVLALYEFTQAPLFGHMQECPQLPRFRRKVAKIRTTCRPIVRERKEDDRFVVLVFQRRRVPPMTSSVEEWYARKI